LAKRRSLFGGAEHDRTRKPHDARATSGGDVDDERAPCDGSPQQRPASGEQQVTFWKMSSELLEFLANRHRLRRMPRRARAKTAILSVRLLPDEKRYLTLAAEREADEIAKLIQGVPMTVSSFVRWAALQKAEQRLGVSLADFTSGKGKTAKKIRR
jgi:hypothetical protein